MRIRFELVAAVGDEALRGRTKLTWAQSSSLASEMTCLCQRGAPSSKHSCTSADRGTQLLSNVLIRNMTHWAAAAEQA